MDPDFDDFSHSGIRTKMSKINETETESVQEITAPVAEEKVQEKVADQDQMEVENEQILFRTNLDDYVKVGKDNPIRVSVNDKSGEPSPYVLVRDRLEALISRSVYYQLAELAVEIDGQYGVWSGGEFFPLN